MKYDDSESSETDIDYERYLKEIETPPVPKKKGDINKRLPVGFFILSFYVLSYYLGTFYQAFFVVYIQITISKEITSVRRKPQKDKISGI